MLMNLTTSAMGTAVGLSSDLSTGAIDRFRTLPMWRSAVLMGRSIADVLSAALCIVIVAATGLIVGWRPDASMLSILGGLAIPLLFAYSLSWACACLGIVSKGPESAAGVGLIFLFPLAIVSNALVPTQGMPAWLQVIANWNPVSAVTAAARTLFGNPNPSATLACLADATPSAGGARMVGRDPGRVRATLRHTSTGGAPPADRCAPEVRTSGAINPAILPAWRR